MLCGLKVLRKASMILQRLFGFNRLLKGAREFTGWGTSLRAFNFE
jgi:hypothetical protein